MNISFLVMCSSKFVFSGIYFIMGILKRLYTGNVLAVLEMGTQLGSSDRTQLRAPVNKLGIKVST